MYDASQPNKKKRLSQRKEGISNRTRKQTVLRTSGKTKKRNTQVFRLKTLVARNTKKCKHARNVQVQSKCELRGRRTFLAALDQADKPTGLLHHEVPRSSTGAKDLQRPHQSPVPHPSKSRIARRLLLGKHLPSTSTKKGLVSETQHHPLLIRVY